MSEANKAVVRCVFDEIFNNRNFELVPELYADSVTGVDPANGGDLVGHDQLIELLRSYDKALPGFAYTVHALIADGDFVAARWSVENPKSENAPATHTEGISICQFEDGKIKKVWQHWDNLSLLKDLGQIDLKINVVSALANIEVGGVRGDPRE